jgi:hypothetical protein
MGNSPKEKEIVVNQKSFNTIRTTTLGAMLLSVPFFLAAPAEAKKSVRAQSVRTESVRMEGNVPVEKMAMNPDHIALFERFRDARAASRFTLNLSFDLESDATSGKPARRDVQIGSDLAERREELPCLTDEIYDLNYTGAHFFSLNLFENDPSIRLRVYPGDKTSHPLNDASCVHDAAAPGGKRFRLMGEFLAIPVPTPQGLVVQLRPVK